MHFLYVFILQFLYNSTCFERLIPSSSGVHKLTVPAAMYKSCKRAKLLGLTFVTGFKTSYARLHDLYRAVEAVNL